MKAGVPLTITVGTTTIPMQGVAAVPTTPLAVLDFVVALLSDPARWHQGSPACDSNGREVDPCCPTAARWGLEGAIDRAVCADGVDRDDPELGEAEANRRLRLTLAVWRLLEVPVDRFNDAAPHRLVIAEVKRARSKARVQARKRGRGKRSLTNRNASGEMGSGLGKESLGHQRSRA